MDGSFFVEKKLHVRIAGWALYDPLLPVVSWEADVRVLLRTARSGRPRGVSALAQTLLVDRDDSGQSLIANLSLAIDEHDATSHVSPWRFTLGAGYSAAESHAIDRAGGRK